MHDHTEILQSQQKVFTHSDPIEDMSNVTSFPVNFPASKKGQPSLEF